MKRGFAVVEGLVSGVMLAIFLTSIVATLAFAIITSRGLRDQAIASGLGRDLMEELVSANDPAVVESRAFDAFGAPSTDPAAARFFLTSSVGLSAVPTIRRVGVTVTWGSPPHKLVLETLRD